jgi:D-alanyl-D-alanine carboxypeptidase
MKKIKIGGVILLFILGTLWFAYLPLLRAYSQSKNAAQLKDIKEVNPAAHALFRSFIQDIETKTDWQVLIVSGYRDEEKQAQLKHENPKNAAAGKSKHNFGKAIDICVFRRKGLFTQWLVKRSSKQAWETSQIPTIAKTYKFRWGGDFSNYHDPVHFEVN